MKRCALSGVFLCLALVSCDKSDETRPTSVPVFSSSVTVDSKKQTFTLEFSLFVNSDTSVLNGVCLDRVFEPTGVGRMGVEYSTQVKGIIVCRMVVSATEMGTFTIDTTNLRLPEAGPCDAPLCPIEPAEIGLVIQTNEFVEFQAVYIA